MGNLKIVNNRDRDWPIKTVRITGFEEKFWSGWRDRRTILGTLLKRNADHDNKTSSVVSRGVGVGERRG